MRSSSFPMMMSPTEVRMDWECFVLQWLFGMVLFETDSVIQTRGHSMLSVSRAIPGCYALSTKVAAIRLHT